MSSTDNELEQLLREVASDDAERDLVREAHRQLEKDLLRLADPLPPPDFLQNVMAKVAQAERAPARIERADVITAVVVLSVCLVGAVAVMGAPGSLGSFGRAMAQVVVSLREGFVGGASVLAAVWKTAALPAVVGLMLMAVTSVAALKRLASQAPATAKVVS